jgi:flagellar biosynthesis protein FlhB
MNMGVFHAFSDFMSSGLKIGMKMGGVLVVIAGLDYFYQYWRYEKDR